MPELFIRERSPDIEVTLVEDDGSKSSKTFERQGKKPIDFDGCKDKNGPGKLKKKRVAGKDGVEVKLPAK